VFVFFVQAEDGIRDFHVTGVQTCALPISLRLYSTLYKSGIQGLEQHGWLNLANIIIATLRYFGGLLLVSVYSQDPADFFEFQVEIGRASCRERVTSWRVAVPRQRMPAY